eukprot:g38303.t1
MLIVFDNVLKAVKMAQFLPSQEILDDERCSIGCIQCLSSEEVITIFRCGMLELVIDELSIVSRSYEDVLQHLQVSVALPLSEQILCMHSIRRGWLSLIYSGWKLEKCSIVRLAVERFVTVLGDIISETSDETMLFYSTWNLFCPVRY